MRLSLVTLCRDFSSLLFPILCPACNTSLCKGEKDLCIKCAYDLPYTDFHLYPENPLAKQFWGRVPLHSAMALLYFQKASKTQNLIHQLKYRNQPQVGIFLGRKIGAQLLSSETGKDINLLIPVPLHPRKEKSRGYNQSECIAKGISDILKVPVCSKILLRTMVTESQTKKDRYKRFENMNQAFRIKGPELLKGKHVLLVDDVITTGATIEACALALQQYPLQNLSVAAAAYTR